MGKYVDLTGQRFGKLVVLNRKNLPGDGNVIWECLCDCGNKVFVTSSSLRSSKARSCGCYHKDKVTKHGQVGSRLYRIWAGMKYRCFNPNSYEYYRYGGRGITVCQDWANDFMNFYIWAMNNGYKEDLTLDRINNNGNYCPENCKWSTIKEQANNRRTNHIVEIDGVRKTMLEWCKEYGVCRSTVYSRLYAGMSFLEALTKPLDFKQSARSKKKKKLQPMEVKT